MNEQEPNSMRLRIRQTIESEEYYPRDPIGQEDFMLDRLADLVEDNLVDPVEAEAIFTDWIREKRPDTVVIHLGSVAVSKPFYE